MGSNVIAGTGQSIAIGSTNTAPDGTQTQTIARGKVTMKNGRPEPRGTAYRYWCWRTSA